MVDSFSPENTKGRAHSIIHRHSRAVAFSIHRNYDLFGQARKPGVTSFHVNTNGTILLATMEVQAQFRTAAIARMLNAHGYLTDEQSGPDGPDSSGDGNSERTGGKENIGEAKGKTESSQEDTPHQAASLGRAAASNVR